MKTIVELFLGDNIHIYTQYSVDFWIPNLFIYFLTTEIYSNTTHVTYSVIEGKIIWTHYHCLFLCLQNPLTFIKANTGLAFTDT